MDGGTEGVVPGIASAAAERADAVEKPNLVDTGTMAGRVVGHLPGLWSSVIAANERQPAKQSRLYSPHEASREGTTTPSAESGKCPRLRCLSLPAQVWSVSVWVLDKAVDVELHCLAPSPSTELLPQTDYSSGLACQERQQETSWSSACHLADVHSHAIRLKCLGLVSASAW
eukprot:3521409-Amphidinium_carterae.1